MEQDYRAVEILKRQVWSLFADMPSRFQVALCSCSTQIPHMDGVSRSRTFESAILEWEVVPGGTEVSDTCICSRNIQHLHYVRNKFSGLRLVVGSECINKFGTGGMRDTLRLNQRMNNYEGEKSPCLSCGTHVKKANLLYCGSCIGAGKLTFGSSIPELMGWKPCIGECAGRNMVFNGHQRIKYCNECDPSWVFVRSSRKYLLTTNLCLSCGEQSDGNPRCKACAKESYPIKCSVPECWKMIRGTPDPVMCDLCTTEVQEPGVFGGYTTVRRCNLRLCERQSCRKIISHYSTLSTCVTCLGKPSWLCPPNICNRQGCRNLIPENKPDYRYCSWSCTPSEIKRKYQR